MPIITCILIRTHNAFLECVESFYSLRKGLSMTSFINSMLEQAKLDKKKIVLAEGEDKRTQEAAAEILKTGFADIIILSNPDTINASGFDLSGAEIIDPAKSELIPELANSLYEIRKAKGITQDEATSLVKDPMYFAVMLVKLGYADGLVSGAIHSTADVLRPSLQIIKTAENSAIVSSFFVMNVPDCEFGENGTFIFADCGLNVNPTSEELAEIAIDSAKSWTSLIGTEPKVAMISHSSYGSAKNDDAAKVERAVSIAKEKDPDLKIDGELQVDAAICSDVASLKCPDSDVAGDANILVFPDLDAGNSGYKLVQRLAKAEAYGPITQGLAKPVNDLSRGCSAKDIVGVCAITCVQAQNND